MLPPAAAERQSTGQGGDTVRPASSSPSPSLSSSSSASVHSATAAAPPSVFAAPSPSDSRQVEGAVVSYLRKRGYAWTEEQLKSLRSGVGSGGSGSGSGSAALSEQAMDWSLDVHACLHNGLFTSHPRLSSPEQFEWTYSRVRAFVLSSLDVYGVELRLVLWPLFLHSFLSLHLRHYPGDAVHFFSQHRKDHEALHLSELSMLAHIHNDAAIRAHDYTRLALSRRIELTMSAFTSELLTAFLEHEGLVTAAYILTEHTQIKLLSRRPWKAEQSSLQQPGSGAQAAGRGSVADKQVAQVYGQSSGAAAAINALDVRWGALPEVVALQGQARDAFKANARAQQRLKQRTEEGDGKAMEVDGGKPTEVTADGSSANSIEGSAQATQAGARADGEQKAANPAARSEDGTDDKDEEVHTNSHSVGNDNEAAAEEEEEEEGERGKGGRRSRRGGKKERKERAARSRIPTDDGVARLASEHIVVFKHTLQQQTVELPDISPEQRQTYIDDLTQRQTLRTLDSAPLDTVPAAAHSTCSVARCRGTSRGDAGCRIAAVNRPLFSLCRVCLFVLAQALVCPALPCRLCAATHSPTPTPCRSHSHTTTHSHTLRTAFSAHRKQQPRLRPRRLSWLLTFRARVVLCCAAACVCARVFVCGWQADVHAAVTGREFGCVRLRRLLHPPVGPVRQ